MAVHGESAAFPVQRPRRLRRTPALRDLVAETDVVTTDLIAPLFVREGIEAPVEIRSLPGPVGMQALATRAAAATRAATNTIPRSASSPFEAAS